MKFTYETDRLLLKIVEPTEAPKVLQFYRKNRALFEQSEPERQTGFYTMDHQRAILTAEYNMAVRGTLLRYWLYLKDDLDEVIGTISFRSIERQYRQSCLLGYKLDQGHWGHGYATEAIREGIRIAFDELSLHRIVAQVMPDNERSIRLMERLGFVNEGVERKCLFINGKWEDHIRFSLISSEAHSPGFESKAPSPYGITA